MIATSTVRDRVCSPAFTFVSSRPIIFTNSSGVSRDHSILHAVSLFNCPHLHIPSSHLPAFLANSISSLLTPFQAALQTKSHQSKALLSLAPTFSFTSRCRIINKLALPQQQLRSSDPHPLLSSPTSNNSQHASEGRRHQRRQREAIGRSHQISFWQGESMLSFFHASHR